jgi:hypothetical protein
VNTSLMKLALTIFSTLISNCLMWGQQKNPWLYLCQGRYDVHCLLHGATEYSVMPRRSRFCVSQSRAQHSQAGLLAHGSSPTYAFPPLMGQWRSDRLAPRLQWRYRGSFFTAFPFEPLRYLGA